MAYNFKKALQSGLNEQQIRNYLREQGREQEADNYFGGSESENMAQDKGFLGNIATDIRTRSTNVASSRTMVDSGRQTLLEGGLQTAGQMAGLAGDVVTRGAEALTPNFIKEPLTRLTEKVAQTEPVQDAVGAYTKWAETNPRAAKDLEAIINIGSLIGGAKVASKTGEAVLSGAKKAAVGLAAGRAERGTIKNFDKIVEIVRPELNQAERAAALSSGQGKIKGVFRTTVIEPSKRDIEIANAAKGVVDPRKSLVENIQRSNKAIEILAKRTEEGLIKNNSIFNVGEFSNALKAAKENSRVLFGSEKTLENTYDAVMAEMVKHLNKYPKTISGALKARKDFDAVIKQKFPKLLSSQAGDDIRRNAVLDVRRTVNEFIADKLPEGNQFKNYLKRQNLLYDAIENMSKKGAKQVGTNPVSRVAKRFVNSPVGKVVGYTALSGGGVYAGAKLLGD
jgi:hypothetical protein